MVSLGSVVAGTRAAIYTPANSTQLTIYIINIAGQQELKLVRKCWTVLLSF